MKDARPDDPEHSTHLSAEVLDWSGVVAALALIVVPLWMLLGNSAVLGGHPALPILLSAAAALGFLWMFRLVTRSALLERWNHDNHTDLPEHQRAQRHVSGRQLLRGLAGRIVALGLVAALAWLNPFTYQPGGSAGEALGSPGTTPTSTTEDATTITLAPEGKARAGLVFYPGARVDARAYQDILRPLANAGYLVVVLKVPLGISLLHPGQARGAIDRHPEITTWAVGGHSLGGVSASAFAQANPEVSGLLLFASYPADSMAESGDLAVLSISGSNDGLTTPDKIAASKPMLPPTAIYTTVEGGVHAFFGDYGEQPGDGEPGISREQAQQQIAAESVRFMDRLVRAG
ncbi:dienelactone hydrolase [Pseudarthrobacter oxydans]|uniref:alpha/beta hydrolase n=1 Tax=Pseudarthrobacter oxydans TaxID=1671 RepID=UPI0027841297|nr:alpha/beta hydrolase [Pseudarthrobacter oxydans]MDP9983510.1 dienelactone hydrolase [Pseudarthrobacter oxydans]